MTYCRTHLKCITCRQLMHNSAFYRDPRYKSGRKQPCKSCLRKRRGDPGWRERARLRKEAAKLDPGPPSKITNDEEPVSVWLERRAKIAELEALYETD